MRFVVHATDAAKLDAAEAAGWYESRHPDLGVGFRAEVKAAVEKLGDNALLNRIRFSDVRRAGLRRFSDYGLFYVIRKSEVIIFAVAHGARNPAWVRRRRNHLN